VIFSISAFIIQKENRPEAVIFHFDKDLENREEVLLGIRVIIRGGRGDFVGIAVVPHIEEQGRLCGVVIA